MKKIIYGIGIIVLLFIAIFFARFNSEIDRVNKAEESTLLRGIVKIGTIEYKTTNSVEVISYYQDKECIKKLNDITSEFNNVQLIQEKKIKNLNTEDKNYINSLGLSESIPSIILKAQNEDALVLITGESACSGTLIKYNLCKFMNIKEEVCNDLKLIETESDQKEITDSSNICHECCNIIYNQYDNIVNRYLCGPICGYVSGYAAGESDTKYKKCNADDCKTDLNDKACCKKNSCVYKGICYGEMDLNDIDEDGNMEICFKLNNDYEWIDPDKNKNSCKNNGLLWFEDYIKTKKIFYMNIFERNDNKESFCCGDDKKEELTKCKGPVCDDNDIACCKKGQCSYKGICYDSGCNHIELDTGRETLYCNGENSEWQDIDFDNCATCLGKKSWTGSFCCGDDIEEGNYYSNFTFYKNKTTKIDLGYSQCTDSKSDCIHPSIEKPFKEGCYFFDSKYKYLQGSYYCDKKIWHDADSKKKYCEKCKFTWIDDDKSGCCGDDEGEYYTEGEDGTYACCQSESGCVKGGLCIPCDLCGNNNLDMDEGCELPNTLNNEYCNAASEKCSGNKLSTNKGNGDCSSTCGCIYKDFSYSCVKGACGAKCNDDKTGCKFDEECNTLDCSCHKKSTNTESEDKIFIPEGCPYSVEISFDKEKYTPNDIADLKVNIFDAKGEGIPFVTFFWEYYVNNRFHDMFLHSTDNNGTYKTKIIVTNKTLNGEHKYLLKVLHKDCPIMVDITIAAFKTTNNLAFTELLDIKNLFYKEIINITKKNPEVKIEKGTCGDGKINLGEFCEGNMMCRNSRGCDYQSYIFDKPDYCNNCGCLEDKKSLPNDNDYCENCYHCGDLKLNCDEECEGNASIKRSICDKGNIYEQFESCKDCKWEVDNSYNNLIHTCFCDCQEQPENNCMNGNYIQYKEDYNPGCLDDGCNTCSCGDIYTKDSNNDGVEDKCSPELCNNKFDDNDNGLIDEEGCIWYYCSDCGHDYLNICDKEECEIYKEGCYFENSVFDFGFCQNCKSLYSCEGYGFNEINCNDDSCRLTGCYWNNINCCTDNDYDKICDYDDNCPKKFNPMQNDSDNDGIGDNCEFCINEPLLKFPNEKNESSCDNKIDDDCDGFLDCEDDDCSVFCLNESKRNAMNKTGNFS